MAFWGIEVEPGKPYTHRYDEEKGRLQLSQATLGNGSSTKKSILQCQVGEKKPIYLCTLLPDKMETCALNLEFEEEGDVIFSVQGPLSIHLSGFFMGEYEEPMRDAYESDSYGEEISGTESSEYDSEEGFEGDFSDDDADMYLSPPVPNSGVVIEEIEDGDKPAPNNGTSKNGKKKKQFAASANKNTERLLVVKGNNGDQTPESEDEDGFPILPNDKNKVDASGIKEKTNEVKDKRSNEEVKKKHAKDESSIGSLKRKAEAVAGDKEEKRKSGQQPVSPAADAVAKNDKQKEKNKKKKTNNEEAIQLGDEGHQKQSTEKNISIDANSADEEKKRNNKNKKQAKEAEANAGQVVANKKESSQKKTKGKSQVRTFPNGLVIEEVAMGKPDGKKASPGKKVSVHYIGKLKKNGEIFDSNIGRAPFKFRLGVGQVVKGWDVGVNGMRVGDKRRLTIPPAMGYGVEGAGKAIPPNAWLVFDVELVAVN